MGQKKGNLYGLESLGHALCKWSKIHGSHWKCEAGFKAAIVNDLKDDESENASVAHHQMCNDLMEEGEII